jgi:glycosyltransferase involved in cell wall biosynthesis
VRFLFCCDLYHPSVGGVQEVMRQIAERMVQAGHRVTVATRRLAGRQQRTLNGVEIAEFDVSGDLVTGLKGEVDRYQNFVASFPADAIMIKAAHQWSFDACWPVLDRISARKVFIPCGLTQYFNPAFRAYFKELPAVLRKFDRLVFYSEHYHDIDFVQKHGLTNFTIVPNAASEIEFSVAEDPTFRKLLGIPQDDFVILTVGSPPDGKGHPEVAAAFAKMDARGRSMSLILIGDWYDAAFAESGSGAAASTLLSDETHAHSPRADTRMQRLLSRAVSAWRERGPIGVAQFASSGISWRLVALRRMIDRWSLDRWIQKATAHPLKSVFRVRLPRELTVQAFLSADLFVFASRTEYSPLVLFEAAAAGTPFITVPVGNADEIVRWTGGGILCPAPRDRRGFTRADPAALARAMERVVADEGLRTSLAEAGRGAWRTTFNWRSIAKRYEAILTDVPATGMSPSAAVPPPTAGPVSSGT